MDYANSQEPLWRLHNPEAYYFSGINKFNGYTMPSRRLTPNRGYNTA
jgi:hypothetical protein